MVAAAAAEEEEAAAALATAAAADVVLEDADDALAASPPPPPPPPPPKPGRMPPLGPRARHAGAEASQWSGMCSERLLTRTLARTAAGGAPGRGAGSLPKLIARGATKSLDRPKVAVKRMGFSSMTEPSEAESSATRMVPTSSRHSLPESTSLLRCGCSDTQRVSVWLAPRAMLPVAGSVHSESRKMAACRERLGVTVISWRVACRLVTRSGRLYPLPPPPSLALPPLPPPTVTGSKAPSLVLTRSSVPDVGCCIWMWHRPKASSPSNWPLPPPGAAAAAPSALVATRAPAAALPPAAGPSCPCRPGASATAGSESLRRSGKAKYWGCTPCTRMVSVRSCWPPPEDRLRATTT